MVLDFIKRLSSILKEKFILMQTLLYIQHFWNLAEWQSFDILLNRVTMSVNFAFKRQISSILWVSNHTDLKS